MKLLRGVRDFFRDIVHSVKSGTVLGIDIGTTSIKVVELAAKGERFVLANYGILETKDYLRHTHLSLQTSSLQLVEDEAARLLNVLLREMKPKTSIAFVTVPLFASFLTILDMPVLPRHETEQAVRFQAQKYIPMPVEEVQVDWAQVDAYTDRNGNNFQRLALMGIPRKVIDAYRRVCKASRLSLQTIELDVIAAARVVIAPEPTLVVDIGAESTSAMVVEGGLLKHARQTDYGGIHITRAVGKGLGLSLTRAEMLKRQRGILGESGSLELQNLLMPFLDVIMQEAGYARSVYEERYGKKVAQFTLLGGGAHLAGAAEHLSKEFGLPYAAAGALLDVDYPPGLVPAAERLQKELAVAIGPAKRHFYA